MPDKASSNSSDSPSKSMKVLVKEDNYTGGSASGTHAEAAHGICRTENTAGSESHCDNGSQFSTAPAESSSTAETPEISTESVAQLSASDRLRQSVGGGSEPGTHHGLRGTNPLHSKPFHAQLERVTRRSEITVHQTGGFHKLPDGFWKHQQPHRDKKGNVYYRDVVTERHPSEQGSTGPSMQNSSSMSQPSWSHAHSQQHGFSDAMSGHHAQAATSQVYPVSVDQRVSHPGYMQGHQPYPDHARGALPEEQPWPPYQHGYQPYQGSVGMSGPLEQWSYIPDPSWSQSHQPPLLWQYPNGQLPHGHPMHPQSIQQPSMTEPQVFIDSASMAHHPTQSSGQPASWAIVSSYNQPSEGLRSVWQHQAARCFYPSACSTNPGSVQQPFRPDSQGYPCTGVMYYHPAQPTGHPISGVIVPMYIHQPEALVGASEMQGSHHSYLAAQHTGAQYTSHQSVQRPFDPVSHGYPPHGSVHFQPAQPIAYPVSNTDGPSCKQSAQMLRTAREAQEACQSYLSSHHPASQSDHQPFDPDTQAYPYPYIVNDPSVQSTGYSATQAYGPQHSQGQGSQRNAFTRQDAMYSGSYQGR